MTAPAEKSYGIPFHYTLGADKLSSGQIDGQVVDVVSGEVFPGRIEFSGGVITAVQRLRSSPDRYILPGLIDAHIHIESSHLSPSRFAEAVVPHGTTSVVSDPHEIANVSGMVGVKYMIRDSKRSPLRCFFTAPSCVPATPFETSGARLTRAEVAEMLSWPEVVALGEVMDYPGAVSGDEEILAKIDEAVKAGKPIDGHAPMLSGIPLGTYTSRGITTDHECTSSAEAEEKHSAGMLIQVRQGTASKNLPALADFARRRPFMLVSDDRSAHDLLRGHMNVTLAEAVSLGIEPLAAIRGVTLLPARHYRLPGGWLERGRVADMAVVEDIERFAVLETYISGKLVASKGRATFSVTPERLSHSLPSIRKSPDDFRIGAEGEWAEVRTIVAIRDEIVTESGTARLAILGGEVVPDADSDISAIAVVNRYADRPVSNSFVSGFGLREGALASTVAHDSHNCIVVGVEKEAMSKAANLCLETGGFAVVGGGRVTRLELPIAGLMSDMTAGEVAKAMDRLLSHSTGLGCGLPNPFMTLSFMSLLVIPKLKLGDQGLFDVERFEFVDPILRTSEGRRTTE